MVRWARALRWGAGMMKPAILTATLATVVALAGCSMTPTNDVGPSDTTARASSSAPESDSAAVARLEREALALAHNDGCDSAGQCRVAPVGAKACGGPRYWITWCPITTDSAALYDKLEELRAAEATYNQVHGVVSDCSVVPPPTATVSAGVCMAAAN